LDIHSDDEGKTADRGALPLSFKDYSFPIPADRNMYSLHLHNLIRDCMKNPINRPTLDKLEENAEAAFMSLETSRFPGIKRLREDEMPEYMRLSLDAERWTVGSGSRKRRQATEGEGEGEV
jgi:hypothetical protein